MIKFFYYEDDKNDYDEYLMRWKGDYKVLN